MLYTRACKLLGYILMLVGVTIVIALWCLALYPTIEVIYNLYKLNTNTVG